MYNKNLVGLRDVVSLRPISWACFPGRNGQSWQEEPKGGHLEKQELSQVLRTVNTENRVSKDSAHREWSEEHLEYGRILYLRLLRSHPEKSALPSARTYAMFTEVMNPQRPEIMIPFTMRDDVVGSLIIWIQLWTCQFIDETHICKNGRKTGGISCRNQERTYNRTIIIDLINPHCEYVPKYRTAVDSANANRTIPIMQVITDNVMEMARRLYLSAK